MAAYAARTEVTVARSRDEIETILRRYGATQFVHGWDHSQVVVGFTAHGRQVRFHVPMPTSTEYRDQRKLAAEERRRWRCLALAVKAKLEVVESGIATFEDEFLAHIVMPDGRSVGQHVLPVLAEVYESGRVLPMLALEAGS